MYARVRAGAGELEGAHVRARARVRAGTSRAHAGDDAFFLVNNGRARTSNGANGKGPGPGPTENRRALSE